MGGNANTRAHDLGSRLRDVCIVPNDLTGTGKESEPVHRRLPLSACQPIFDPRAFVFISLQLNTRDCDYSVLFVRLDLEELSGVNLPHLHPSSYI